MNAVHNALQSLQSGIKVSISSSEALLVRLGQLTPYLTSKPDDKANGNMTQSIESGNKACYTIHLGAGYPYTENLSYGLQGKSVAEVLQNVLGNGKIDVAMNRGARMRSLIHESQSIVPAMWVLLFACVVLINIGLKESVPFGPYGLAITYLAGSFTIALYFKRSLLTEYIISKGVIGVYSNIPVLGKNLKTMALNDAQYIYSRQTGIRWILAKMGLINYGDLCFCKDVNSSPCIVFHNVKNVKSKLDKILDAKALD